MDTFAYKSNNMKKIILLLCLIIGYNAYSQQLNTDKSNNALQMYDAVGYHQSYAIKGKEEFKYSYKGAIYYFFSMSNKKAFIANPEKYLPAYGGWCAYAMGYDGSLVEIDPTSYKVIDGKTYLFYKSVFNDTREKWNKDEKNLKSKADKNWTKYQK